LYEVIDNFLDETYYETINKTLRGDNFPWFFKPSQYGNDTYFFYHQFYMEHRQNSELFDMMIPVIDKLDVQALMSCRANLVTNCGGWNNPHIDQFTSKVEHTTAILYLGECNGGTKFLDEDIFIDHKPNRLLRFDANMVHQAIHQNDSDIRIVVNFNYF
jgi:hypothetical protein